MSWKEAARALQEAEKELKSFRRLTRINPRAGLKAKKDLFEVLVANESQIDRMIGTLDGLNRPTGPFLAWAGWNWPRKLRDSFSHALVDTAIQIMLLHLGEKDPRKAHEQVFKQIVGFHEEVDKLTKLLNTALAGEYGPAPTSFTFQGFKVQNKEHLSEWVTLQLLDGVSFAKKFFAKKGLKKLLNESVNAIVLAPRDTFNYSSTPGMTAHGLYWAQKREIWLFALALGGHKGKLTDNWVQEVFAHEFGHHVHLSSLSKEAKAFWDSSWDPVTEAEGQTKKAVEISLRERKGFFQLIEQSGWDPAKASRKLKGSAKLKFLAILRMGGWVAPTAKQIRLTNEAKKALSFLSDPDGFIEQDLRGGGISAKDLEDFRADGTFAGEVKRKRRMYTRAWRLEKDYEMDLGAHYLDMSDIVDKLKENLGDPVAQAKAEVVETWGTPTDYATTDVMEDFAESFVQYLHTPERMTENALYRMKRTLWLSGFGGKPIQKLSFQPPSALCRSHLLRSAGVGFEVVDDRGRKRKVPKHLYHVAYLHNLDSIQSRGLRPGSGQTFGGGYGGHSQGRIFLTSKGGADFWFERYGQMAENKTDNPEEGWWPVALRVKTRNIKGDIGYDGPGSQDARDLSVFVENGDIPPGLLEVFDGDAWVALKSVDPEELQERGMAEGAEEDEDDGETWVEMDYDFFNPRLASTAPSASRVASAFLDFLFEGSRGATYQVASAWLSQSLKGRKDYGDRDAGSGAAPPDLLDLIQA